MAILNGLIQKMKGSAGQLTFKSLNGQTVVSEKPTKVSNPRTASAYTMDKHHSYVQGTCSSPSQCLREQACDTERLQHVREGEQPGRARLSQQAGG